MALARLTEVDVHGTDLGIGFDDWSATLVRVGQPTRLVHWRPGAPTTGPWTARGRAVGSSPPTTTQAFGGLVRVDGADVSSAPVAATDPSPDATVEGTARNLLALLQGRPTIGNLRFGGDVQLAGSFAEAFPGP